MNVLYWKTSKEVGVNFNRGLTPKGTKLVTDPEESNYVEEVTRVYKKGQKKVQRFRFVRESKVRVEKSGEIFKVQGEGNEFEGGDLYKYDMYKYIFTDGNVLFERPQKQSAGYNFFTALQDINGNWIKESLWTDEMILESLGEPDVKAFRDWIKEPKSD